MDETIRILYVTHQDSLLRGSSNNGYYLRAAMAREFGDLELFGPVPRAPYLLGPWGTWKLFSRMWDRKERPLFCAPGIASDHGRRVANRAKALEVDLIFGNGPPAVAGLERHNVPYSFMTDATVSGLIEVGGYTDGWAESSVQRWLQTDRLAVLGAQDVFYASQWAAECAIRDYGADPNRVHFVPPGANIDEVPDVITLRSHSEPWNLLFYGRDWTRKGGDFALSITTALREQGFDARLLVCGPNRAPFDSVRFPFVTFVSPIDKDTPGGIEALADLCARCHFLLLPTRSDCTPGAIREAMVFGLPAIATDVGGIASLISDGLNGFLFPLGTEPSAYASKIAVTLQNEEAFNRLQRGARDTFETALNWAMTARSISGVLKERF